MGSIIRQIFKNSYTRLLLVIFLLLFFVSFFFIFYTYLKTIRSFKTQELTKLNAVANTLSLQLNGDEYDSFITSYKTIDEIHTNEQDSIYLKNHSILKKAAKLNGIVSPIYTLTKVKNHFEFIFTSANEPYFRHEYLHFPESLVENYDIGGDVTAYEDENGMWISAFAPIKNSTGKTVGIIMVDTEFMKLITNARMLAIREMSLLVFILLLIGYFLYIKVKNFLINEENIKLALEFKNREIGFKNLQITDSINYALRIQKAILPKPELLVNHKPEFLILYKPKDIISGDFYWFCEFENKAGFFLAVVDCTGHGVPGALMSMVANNLLNSIIGEQKINDLNTVLCKLELGLRSFIKEKNPQKDTSDGMDLGILKIDYSTSLLTFSGARLPLIQIKNEKIEVIKGTKRSIGNAFELDKLNFEVHEITFQVGDVFYLFTDGYADQFGGNDNKKFMIKNLKDLLFNIHRLPIFQQKEILEKTLISWQNKEVQTDDVTLIGLKF